jgi:hypothetical protein
MLRMRFDLTATGRRGRLQLGICLRATAFACPHAQFLDQRQFSTLHLASYSIPKILPEMDYRIH